MKNPFLLSSNFIFGILLFFQYAIAVPLDTVLARSDSCVRVTWIPESLNTNPSWYIQCGAKCTGSDSVCLHSDFIPGIPYRGIAYSYGCNDPYEVFRGSLEEGKLAGSHLCHYNSCSSPCETVTGIDCSAFVCWAWNVPRQSTGMLYDNHDYQHIIKADLAPGDILVNPSNHCVLIMEKDGETNYVIQESTGTPVNGCRERLIDISDTYWNKYYSVRNPEIVESQKIKNFTFNLAHDFSRLIRRGMLYPADAGDFYSINVFSLSGKKILQINNGPALNAIRLPRGAMIISILRKTENFLTFSVVNTY